MYFYLCKLNEKLYNKKQAVGKLQSTVEYDINFIHKPTMH